MTRFPMFVAIAALWTGISMAQVEPSVEQLRKELDADLAALRQKGEPVTVDALAADEVTDRRGHAARPGR